METINLDWNGPLQIGKFGSDLHLAPGMTGPGVYMWVRPGPVADSIYIGKAGNLLWRVREHICKVLGGLYSVGLETGEQWYVPDGKDGGRSLELLNDLDLFSARAVKHAKSLSFYVASCPAEYLRTVESILIQAVKGRAATGKVRLENMRIETPSSKTSVRVCNLGAPLAVDVLGSESHLTVKSGGNEI